MLGCSIRKKRRGQLGAPPKEKEINVMSNSNRSSNKIVVPEAREAMDKFKMEAANDLGVPTPY